MRSIHEECGVFGIYGKDSYDVASSTYMALYALQHRGQESAGIAVNDHGVMTCIKDVGLVPEVFNKERLDALGDGQIAIGHVRYSNTGVATRQNAQPLAIRHIKGPMALAHNGSIVNVQQLREKYEMEGAIFHTGSDTEIMAHCITKQRICSNSIEEALEKAMYEMKGAYSLVMMSARKLIAARDPQGIRPLSLGRLGDEIVFASETCAFDSLGATFIRDVEPGEIVIVDKNGIRSIKTHCGQHTGLCVFEFIYLARPDSVVEGSSVHEARQRAGAFLALDHPVQADVVIGVPDSGLDAALGYSKQSGIPYGVGFIKNRYIGRTFIQPTQKQRERSVHIKLNVLRSTVEGKRVVLVDDSIVRGTTSTRIVKILREAGAKEVHMRVSAPPFIDRCYFGTDVDSKDKLIACQMNIEEMAKYIGVDSLGFLGLEHLDKLACNSKCGFCKGCFTGEYPIEVPDEMPMDKYMEKLKK